MTQQDPICLITRKDAAAFLKMSTRHFDREARRRRIALVKVVRSIYITREQLTQWHAVRFPETKKPQTRVNGMRNVQRMPSLRDKRRTAQGSSHNREYADIPILE